MKMKKNMPTGRNNIFICLKYVINIVIICWKYRKYVLINRGIILYLTLKKSVAFGVSLLFLNKKKTQLGETEAFLPIHLLSLHCS